MREADQDSYRLIAAAESYWRAFQTNGTPEYHRAALMPDATRCCSTFRTRSPRGGNRNTGRSAGDRHLIYFPTMCPMSFSFSVQI
jgi:hypothetical protein